MSGFDPVGSAPVGSLGGGLVGTWLSPAPGDLSLSGTTPAISGARVEARQLTRETLYGGGSEVRARQLIRESLYGGGSEVRVRQLVRETLRSGGSVNTEVHARQLTRETLYGGGSEVHARQLIRESLISTTSPTPPGSSEEGCLWIIW